MKEWRCQRDGACCTQPSAVLMRTEEWLELAAVTPQRPVTLDTSRLIEGFVALKAQPCPFYDLSEKACTVYEKRPYNCRRFMCGRWDPSTQRFTVSALPMILRDNDLRWAYRQNEARQRAWALAHGWVDESR